MRTCVPKQNQKSNFSLRFRPDQSGSVLVLVVWMMALLSFWVLASGQLGAASLGKMTRIEHQLTLEAAARAVIPQIAKILEEDATPKQDSLFEPFFQEAGALNGRFSEQAEWDVSFQSWNHYTGRFEKKAGMEDEERKLNLNALESDTLYNLLLTYSGLKEKEVLILTDRILDWRDEDSEEREQGAEKYDYNSAKNPYECKDGPFDSVEELLLVKGMTPAVYKKISPLLTVYGSGKLNLNTATPGSLLVMGMSEAGVNGMTAYRAGVDGEAGTADDPVLATVKVAGAELSAFVPQEDILKIAQWEKAEQVDVVSTAFRFSAEARLADEKDFYRIHVVMEKDGEVLAWLEE